MITLASLSIQLQDQLFAATMTAVPSASRTEAIRQALAQLNAAFLSTYTIANLDGSTATTLPDSYVAALLLGASAFILDFSIQSRFIGYHDTPEVSEKLVSWAKSIKEEFEVALNQLRLVDLQQATNPPAFQIPDAGNDYDLALDA